VKRILIAAALLVVPLLYCVDAGILRYRVAKNVSPYDNISVQTYYIIPRKDGKGEYVFGDPATETCVNSLFPQMGDRPCWYARRHNTKEVAP
jgi:hypothetical protein